VLSAATAEDPKNIRQASMPQAIVLFLASSQLVVTGIMAKLGLKTPVRFSSTKRGSVMKPGVYVLIEDIVAVDGGGGQEFREALLARYESSKGFQRLVEQMNWFWGIGSILVAGGTTAIVYAVDDLNVVFALGRCDSIPSMYELRADSNARLEPSVDMGWNWCHHFRCVDEADAQIGARPMDGSASVEIEAVTTLARSSQAFGERND
jgi:hypothetical protein